MIRTGIRTCRIVLCLSVLLICSQIVCPDATDAKGGGPTFDGNMPGAGTLKVPGHEEGSKPKSHEVRIKRESSDRTGEAASGNRVPPDDPNGNSGK